MRSPRLSLAGALLLIAPPGCALRLGGPGPEALRVVVATVPADAPAAATADWLRRLEADVVLLARAGAGDGEWYAQVAHWTELELSGPALPAGLAAFAAWPALGDTTRAIGDSIASLALQDALYDTGDGRMLDLLLASVPAGADARDATRALMTYVATDVMHDAIVLLALRAHDRATADSIGMLIEPAFAGVARCEDQHELLAGIAPGALRLYYSPALRVRCDAVRGFASPFPALLARVVLDG